MNSVQNIPVLIYCGLSFAPDKSWQIGMLPSTTTSELLQLLAPTINVYPNQIALFLNSGNNEQQVPDGASPVTIFQQYSQMNPQIYFIIRERVNQQYVQQDNYNNNPTQQQNYNNQFQQENTPMNNNNNNETVESIQNKLKTVKEELSKIESQKGVIDKKKIQIETSIETIEKKIFQVQAFESNFPPGTKNNLIQQKQQYSNALSQVSQAIYNLNEKEQKYQQFISILEDKLFQLKENEKSISKANTLQKASSIIFEPNISYENEITAPDYVITQLNSTLKQYNISLDNNLNIIEKLIYLIQSQCPFDKSIRFVLLITTDLNNRQKLAHTRLIPILLNSLQSSDDLSIPLKKNIFTILFNLSNNEENQHSLAKAGIIPIAISYLHSIDSSISELSLKILYSVLIDDIYFAIFQHNNGINELVNLFSNCDAKLQIIILKLLSVVGFSDEEDAISFVNGSGNISAILDLIDNPDEHELKESAILIIISLTKTAPVPMIESGSVSRVIRLIDSNNDNLELLLLCIDSLIPLLINTYIKQTICESILIHLIILLDSSNNNICKSSLTLLSQVIEDSTWSNEFEENNGYSKISSILCNPSSNEIEIESSIKLLSNIGFNSISSQNEFVTQGGIDIILVYLMREEKNDIVYQCISILSQLIDYHDRIIDNIKHANLIISHFNNDNVNHIISFINSLVLFSNSKNINIINYFIDANITNILKILISHFNEKIVFSCLNIIINICNCSYKGQISIINNKLIPDILNLLLSKNDNIRKTVLDFILKISSISNEINIEFSNNNISQILENIFTKEKPKIIINSIKSLAKNYIFQCNSIKSGLLDQIIRHLRSKDIQLVIQIIELFIILSRNNIYVVSHMISNGVEIQIIRLIESFSLRAKLQLTDRLIYSINQCLTLIINLCILSKVRYYINHKTFLISILKKIKELHNETLIILSNKLLFTLNFPNDENDILNNKIEFKSEWNSIIRQFNNNYPINEWENIVINTNNNNKKILVSKSILIENILKEFKEKENTKEIELLNENLSPLEKEKNIIAKKISIIEQDYIQSKEQFQLNQIDIESINNNMEILHDEITLYEDLNDDCLLPEIESKKNEYLRNDKLLKQLNNKSIELNKILLQKKEKYEQSQSDKDKLLLILEELESLKKLDKNNIFLSKRLKNIIKLYASLSNFINILINFKREYIYSLLSYNEIKYISLTSSQLQDISLLIYNIEEIIQSSIMLNEKLKNNLLNFSKLIEDKNNNNNISDNDIKIGNLIQIYSELLNSLQNILNNYDNIIKLFNSINENIDIIGINFNLLKNICNDSYSFSNYIIIILRRIFEFNFELKSLLNITEVTHYDYTLLNGSIKKLNGIQKSLERNNINNIKKIIPIKNKKYKDLISFLAEDDFSFIDTFGDIKESENIIGELIKLFAAQGMLNSYLEHLITKEIDETYSQATLFRGSTITTQSLSTFTHIIGKEYLKKALTIYFHKLHKSEISLEVNPSSLGVPDENHEKVKSQQILLRKECENALSFINGTIDQCPIALKNVCHCLRTIVGNKFPENEISSVGGLIFLRFISPCFVTPERFNICTSISRDVRRNCILVSKVLQNLSNNVEFGKKEPFMLPFNNFIDEYKPKMNELLNNLSYKHYEYEEDNLLDLLTESDLYKIHLTLYENQGTILKHIQSKGKLTMRDKLDIILTNLGIPSPPEEETQIITNTNQVRKSKRPFSIRLSRKKSIILPTTTIVDNSKRKYFYKLLIQQLSFPKYILAQILWDSTDLKTSEKISKGLVQIYDNNGCSVDCVKFLIQKEINECCDPATLFRSNSLAPKYISEFSQYIGNDYLISVIKPLITKLIDSDINMEVNPRKLQDESLAEQGQKELTKACEEWFNHISNLVKSCPIKLKLACKYLKEFVTEKFPKNALIAVGGLYFLRYICPAIINPERLHIVESGVLTPSKRRNLILICKVLQNLSNDILFGNKEPFMIPLNDFINNYRTKMQNLLTELTIVPEDIVIKNDNTVDATEKWKDILEIMKDIISEKTTEIQNKLEEENADNKTIDGFKAISMIMDDAFPKETVELET